MKPFCSFQNVLATHPLIHSELSYPFCCRVSMLQIHGRAWRFIMKPFLLLFICVAMTQKCCSQGACPTARDCTKNRNKIQKPPNVRYFRSGDWPSPLGPGSLSTPIPRKETQKKNKDEEGTRFLNLFPCKVKRVEAKTGPTLRMKKRV